MLDKCFEDTIRTIYDWRSKLVHGERLPPVTEIAMVSDIYENEPIIVTLTISELKPLFERMITRYFDRLPKK
ncbi:hypothetical protein MUP77_09840 [Candidatus Bathyarchaeota archaeon]|nr:hypothetical protein [Candidatus Bathyarchaeota archaeon]